MLSKIYVIAYAKIMHYLNFESFPAPYTIRKSNLKFCYVWQISTLRGNIINSFVLQFTHLNDDLGQN